MFDKQKETVLALVKSQRADRNYEKGYWIPYKDFLDPKEDFTEFSCERLEGKEGYLALIENLLHGDETAEVFVQVYGFEEDKDEQWIYADTLFIFSRLPLLAIKQIFNEPKDIFPSDIGEETDLSRQFLVNEKGELIPAAELRGDGRRAYYCWWD